MSAVAPPFQLELRGMSKAFAGVKALDEVTLAVRGGTVHALMGENGAGKSTLMKCLFGLYHPDRGQVLLDGQVLRLSTPRSALDQGVAMIHQELHPIPHRSVMENIWLGHFPLKGIGPLRWVDHQEMEKKTRELFAGLRIDLDPKARVGALSVSQVQQVEIAKAVAHRSRVLIMDEPTSSLTQAEVEHLFGIIKDLRAKGTAVLYISHKMEEILRISDEVSIMRDGKLVGTWPAAELTEELIIARMVGRELTQRFPPRSNEPGEVVLDVRGLTSPSAKSFREVSFTVRSGEVLGVGGLMGAQRTEVLEALFGLRPIASGDVRLRGKPVRIRSPRDAKRLGLSLLTEDRRGSGIFPAMSVLENTVIANLNQYVRRLLLSESLRRADAEREVERLRVKAASLEMPIANLSGGNQQKVLLARWLLTRPEVLLLDEPTRGVDVGAKYEIYSIIAELAKQGKSIVMISSELPELLGMSDRILVMCEGRVAGELSAKDATQEAIMHLATRFKTAAEPRS